MYEISRENALEWGKTQNNSRYFLPKHVNVLCSNAECRSSLVGIVIAWHENHANFAWARPVCTVCKEGMQLFVVNPKKLDEDEVNRARVFAYPTPSPELEIPEGLEEISPRFITVFEQANNAGEAGYDELHGMGYRKALEILVKDYAIYKNPDDKDAVQQAFLKQVIDKYIADDRIKEIARRATWLGNDETHYLRKWKGMDIDNLRELMMLTLY